MSKFYPLVIVSLLFVVSAHVHAQVNANFTVNLPNPACNPAIVGFNNSSTGIAPLTYQWNFGVYAGVNSVFQNPYTTYLNCGTYTVTLIVTNGLGEKDTATQNLTINCTPTVDFTVSNLLGCAPFTPTYTDLSIPNSGVISTVEWDFGDGYLGLGDTAVHTYNAIGCNTVTLIVTNSFGCKANKTVPSMICVQEPPVAAFTSSDPTSCAAPLTVNFSDASTGGTGPYDYVWNFTNAVPAVDSTANPVISFTGQGSSGVSLTITDQNGCSSTVTDPDYVTIANNSIDFSSSTFEGCAPWVYQPLGISSTSVLNWSWTVNPGNLTASGQTPSFNLNIPDTYTVCLTATFSGSCQATICKDVVALKPPMAQFSVIGPDTTCMRPTSVSFNNLSTGDTLSYSWSFPGGSPASSVDSLPTLINYTSCGSYNALLTVTDINGCTAATNQNNILTIVCPQANFSVFPAGGCIPLTSTFNSAGSVGNNIVQYLWDFGDPSSGADNYSTDPNPSHTFNNEGCYNVTLIIVTAEGCTDTITINNAVCAGTIPQVNFSVNPGIACANDQISFTNLSTNVNPYTLYIWDFIGVPPYDNMSNGVNPTYVYNDTGYFDVTLIASNFGCNDTLTINDAVYLNPPVAHIQLTRDCATPYIVTLSGTSSLGAQTYTWVIPGATPSAASTPTVTVTYTMSGNYSASLYITNDSTGCDDQTQINIPIRDVYASFSGTPLMGCAPLQSCMNNTSTDAVSHAWTVFVAGTNTIVATSTQTNPCFTISTPGVFDVRLIATNMFGCKDTLIRPSYITVWGPIVNFIANPLEGCTPLVVQFTDLSSAPTSTIVSWNWNFGDPISGIANTSTLQNPTHTFYNPGYYTIKLTVTDDHGCVKTLTKNNYIHAVKPKADFTLSKTILCYGEIACFTNSSTGSGLSYVWNFGNGDTSFLTTPCITYYNSGSYDITLYVTDQLGCKDTIIKPNYVTVTKPTANFVADTLSSTCPPLKVTFTNLSSNIDTATTYFWNFGDNSVSIAPNPVHIYNLPGSYTVTLIVTNANGCKDTLTIPNYINIGGPQGYVTTPVTSGCSPLTVCFTATAPTAQYFTWNFGDGTVMPDDDSVCYIYNLPGVYNPELILDDGLGCVYALPIGQITVGGVVSNIQTSADTICGPGTVQFNSNAYSYMGSLSYQWNFGDPASGAQNTSTLANPVHYFSAIGSYTVTLSITTSDGCVDYHAIQITVLSKPHAAFIASDVSVCPPSMISFNNQSTSVYPIVSYSWNFGDPGSGAMNTSSFPNPSHYYTSPGTYAITLTITDQMGCSDVVTHPLTVNPPVSILTTPDQNICSGSGVVLSASGASSYVWSPATGLNTTANASVLAHPTVTTTYTVIGTSVYGCTALTQVVVNVKPKPQIDSIIIVADTCSVAMGAATIFVSNGTSPYTYLWNIGNTTNNITNVAGGFTYSLTVTDAQNCTTQASVSIPALGPALLTSNVSHSTCENNNGAIILNISGAQAPYQFFWNNGATTKDINGLYAGYYAVTVTDAFGCTSSTSTNVNNIASPIVNINIHNATCSLDNGIAIALLNGGTSPFQYIWNTSQTTSSLNNLSPAIYSVTVTDNNGCTGSATNSLINLPGPSLSIFQQNATCEGNNASIDLTISAGTTPMQINWNNGFSFAEDLYQIYSGNYTVTVTDANGCKDSISTIITDTPKPHLNVTKTPATCGSSNGAIDITVVQGISPYSFLWSNGATTEDLNNVAAGLHYLTVTSANGCVLDTVIIIDNIDAPTASIASTQPTCGLSNGSATISLVSGTAPFTYLWSTGATTSSISNLSPGIYDITVIDGNACNLYTTVPLTNIPGPSLSTTPINATCSNANGGIQLLTSGGTAPFSYLWSTGNTSQNLTSVSSGVYNVTVTDNNGCTSIATQSIGNTDGASVFIIVTKPTCAHANGTVTAIVSAGTPPYNYLWSNGETTASIVGVPQGIYTVTVTDLNSCSTIESVNLQEVPSPELSLDGDQPKCGLNNGVIFSSVSGFDPFIYNWSNSSTNDALLNIGAGTYTLTVTDVYGCTVSGSFVLSDNGVPSIASSINNATCDQNNGSIALNVSGGTLPFQFIWNTSDTIDHIENLASGLYLVSIVDANGCTAQDDYFVSQLGGPSVNLNVSSTTCGLNNGTISAVTLGGTAPFNFIWSTGATTNNLSSLAPGLYSITVHDSYGCVTVDSALLTPILGPFVSDSITNTTCTQSNGAIILDVSGGVSPYAFNWNNYTYITKDLINVPTGIYSVTITDANGCQAFLTDTIIDTPGPSTIQVIATTATCGNANAFASVSVSGGTHPYSYAWSNSQTTDTIFNIIGNTAFQVTVTDANNCSIQGSVSVINMDGPSISGVVTNSSCSANNGSIDLSITSGTLPFTFLWSNGATTEDINNLSANTYSVTVADANNCVQILSFNVDSISGPYLSYSSINTHCGLNNGSVDVTVNGGQSPFVYNWNAGTYASQDLVNINAGVYQLVLTDANNCVRTISVVLTDTPGPTTQISGIPSTCGFSNGSTQVIVSGGTTPYYYSWSNIPASADSFAIQLAGNKTYSVTVTDDNGCSVVDSIFINNIAGPSVSNTSNGISCPYGTGYINLNLNGGTAPYNFNWNNGATDQNLSGLVAGTYSVVVTDANGCQAMSIRNITAAPPMNTTVVSNNPSCGTNNGNITVTLNSGIGPFTYQWNSGETISSLNNINAGLYTVTVTDFNSCIHTDSVILTSQGVPTIYTTTTPAHCNGNDGSASLSVHGGVAPYQITWNTGSNDTLVNNLSSGVYSVTVTDANNCSVISNLNIGTVNGPSVLLNVTDATCQQSNGNIQAMVSSNSAYTLLWSNGSTNENIDSLNAGSYSVTVVDFSGCSVSNTALIATSDVPVINVNSIPATCNTPNGSINAIISGGTAPYAVLWSTGSTLSHINNLNAGHYDVSVTDNAGCIATDSFEVTSVSLFNIQVSSTPEACNQQNGSALVTVNGTTAPYFYVWSNNATSQNISNVSSGTYTVSVTDSIGCTTAQTVVVATTGGPIITPSIVDATCNNNNASISLSVNGGAVPYSYQWSTNETTNTLIGIGAGVYSVSVIDANGCSNVSTIQINTSAAPILFTDSVAICKGATATLHVSGALSYQWFNASGSLMGTGETLTILPMTTTSYTVIGTAPNGCLDTAIAQVTVNAIPTVTINGLNNAYCLNANDITLSATPAGGVFSGTAINGNIFEASSLGAGTYTITYAYTDTNGCSASIATDVTIHSLPAINATAGSPQICIGSSVSLNAFGASTYTWSPFSSLSTSTGATVMASPTVATTYTVTGTDTNGCTASNQVVVNVGSSIALSLSNNNPQLCIGNNTTLTASGATSYTWLPATGLSTTTGSSVTTSVTQTSTYTVVGTDTNGCSGTSTVVVTVNPPPVITATNDTLICNGSNATLTASGAQTYTWVNGINMYSGSTITVSPVSNTSWVVIGTDINGCTSSATTQIIVAANPNVTATNGKVCEGQSTLLSASGASTYSWAPNINLNTNTGNSVIATSTSSQTYTIIGTSAEGCTGVAYSVLTVDATPVVSFNGLNLNYCFNNAPVTLTGNPSGGIFNGTGMNGNLFFPQTAGVGGPYTITYSYTNNNGCSATDTQLVTVFANPIVSVSNASACLGTQTTLIANGASTYIWLPAVGLNITTGNTVQATVFTPTTYTVTGVSNNGCSAQAYSNITVNPNPQLNINNSSPEVCQGANVNLFVTGANTYEWSPATGLSSITASQNTVSVLTSTTYTIIGMNTFGCKDTLIIPITVNAVPSVIAGPDTAICFGQSVQLTAAATSSIVWSPSTSLDNATSNNPTASPAQTTTYTVTTTGANGCTATDQVVVQIVSYPSVTINGGGIVCLGNSVNLSADGGTNYTWVPETYLNTGTGESVISTPQEDITYYVTAQNATGCVSTDSVKIKVKKPITVHTQPGANICEGSSYQLAAYGTGITYIWTPALGLDNPYSPFPTATPTHTTTYTVTTSDGVCFTASATAVVEVNPLPVITTDAQVIVVAGSETQLQANSNLPNASFEWTPAIGLSCVTCSNPLANPTHPTTYTVTVTDSLGCRADAEVRLDFLCSEDGIYVPNAFTPNGDGKNDVFKIRGNGVNYITVFRVYSRWGELMFETSDISQGWDGTFKGEPQFPAVYVYYIEGVCSNNQKIVKQGNVTLIR